MNELNMASVGCVWASSINVKYYRLHMEDRILDSQLSMDFLVLQSNVLLN